MERIKGEEWTGDGGEVSKGREGIAREPARAALPRVEAPSASAPPSPPRRAVPSPATLTLTTRGLSPHPPPRAGLNWPGEARHRAASTRRASLILSQGGRGDPRKPRSIDKSPGARIDRERGPRGGAAIDPATLPLRLWPQAFPGGALPTRPARSG